jgi:DNA-binding MurR/RpiR family transcriptional regulator
LHNAQRVIMARLTITEIAVRVGVHKSTVSRQARAAGLVGADGKVDLEEYQALRRTGLDPSLQPMGKATAPVALDGPNYNAQRAKREAAEAALAEMKLARQRGEMVTVPAVEAAAASAFGRAMARFSEAWPEVAVDLASMTDPAAIAERLAETQRRVMAALNTEFLEDAARRSAA